MGKPKLEFSRQEKATFRDLGYVILRRDEYAQFKSRICERLLPFAVEIAERMGGLPADVEPAQCSFDRLFNCVIANESSKKISSRFYELFPVVPETIALISDPLMTETARAAGVAVPMAGTLPLLRIDRPGDDYYTTPAHQDYWYSLLCDNAVVIWQPVLPITPEMGQIRVIPGSHTRGLIPFKPAEGNEPYTTRENYDEDSFEAVDVPEDGVLVFSQYLLHKSGPNRSSRARFTLQLRYNDLRTLKTMAPSFTPKHSNFVQAEQERLLAQWGG